MADIASIWNLQDIRLYRRHKMKGVTGDVHSRSTGKFFLDFWHVACDTLTARTARLMMGVGLN